MTDITRSKQRRLALLSAVIGILGALLIAEVAVRILFNHHSPDTVREHSLTYRQTVYAPFLFEREGRLVDVSSEKAWGKVSGEEARQGFYINDLGFRGPAFEIEKPAGVYRIVVVGGSAAFDQNVFDTPESAEQSWPHRMGAALRWAGHSQVEVVNAGLPGTTSADSLGRVFSQLWLYEPDMLVVYHGWNDIKYWHRRAITPETPLIDRVAPWDPTDNPLMYYRGPVDRFLSNSQLYTRLRNFYFLWRIDPDTEGGTRGDVELAANYGRDGPRQFALNLRLLVEAARSVGAEPVIVTQATLATPDNAPADRARIGVKIQHLDHDAVVRALAEARAIAREVADETGALLIDPSAAMNGRPEWFDDAIHTTPEGSAELARRVAAALARHFAKPADN